MGNLAVRFPNRKLLWDGENMKVTNDDEANAYVRRRYREGWTLSDKTPPDWRRRRGSSVGAAHHAWLGSEVPAQQPRQA